MLVVLISIQILPFEMPSITPYLVSMTVAEIEGDGRQVIIKSLFFANSIGVSSQLAPFSINCTAFFFNLS